MEAIGPFILRINGTIIHHGHFEYSSAPMIKVEIFDAEEFRRIQDEVQNPFCVSVEDENGNIFEYENWFGAKLSFVVEPSICSNQPPKFKSATVILEPSR